MADVNRRGFTLRERWPTVEPARPDPVGCGPAPCGPVDPIRREMVTVGAGLVLEGLPVPAALGVRLQVQNPDDFPGAKACDENTMAIPLHNRMSADDYAYVVESLRAV